jgi:hypothetical protein
MKGMADDLRALGEIITDRRLVLNLLQGLNKRFDHMKIFIKQSQLFPSVHTIHNDLELEKIKLDNLVAQGQASAFYSTPQEVGVLCSSNCLHTHRSRNYRVLWWTFPLLPPPPTTAAKARGMGKARTMVSTAPVTIARAATPRRGPPYTILGPAPSRCGQGCTLCNNSRRVHCGTPCLLL